MVQRLPDPAAVPSSMLSGGQAAGKAQAEQTAPGSQPVAPVPGDPAMTQHLPQVPASQIPVGDAPARPRADRFTTAQGADGRWKLTPAAGG